MRKHRITLLKSQEIELKEWLVNHPENNERGAFVLFRQLAKPAGDLPVSHRFLLVEIIRLENDWVIDSSETHLTINMRNLPELFFRCESENLVLGFIHNHPNGYSNFSSRDDRNELNILKGLSSSNGQSLLISLVLTENKWIARIRSSEDSKTIIPVKHVSVLGKSIELHNINLEEENSESTKRQEAAFGKPFNSKLKSLRVAVVGSGGTGSPLSILLARSGVGELILIDDDTLDKSNMNRVFGFKGKDVGKKKSISLAKHIKKLGLGTKVISIEGYLHESPEALDALSSADVIFGCTDDLKGRDIMNQALYYYAQIYIDTGLTGFVDMDSDGYPYLRDHRGRVSCILPEFGACLRCQNIVKDEWIEFENATKENPALLELDTETLRKEHYLIGGGEQAPGVGPFTSMTASNAMATFMNLIRQFRMTSSDLRLDNVWIDFIHLYFHSNEPDNNPDCIYCRKQDLLMKEEVKYRLDMPSLGEFQK